MDPTILALLAGGTGASVLGSLFGAARTGRDARKARDYRASRTGEGYERYGRLFYGDIFGDLVRASRPDAEGQAAGQRFTAAIGGPLYTQMQELARFGRGEVGRIRAGYDDATRRVMEQYAGVGRLAEGAENMAREYGRGRSAMIEREVGRAAKDADQVLAAQLGAAGFGGSTAGLLTRAGSKRRYAEFEQDAKQRLAEDVQDRVSAARSQRLGIGMNQANALQAMLGGRLAFDERGLGTELNLQNAPISAALAFQNSPIANPWLGVNTSAYYPGASGIADAASQLGQVGVGLGGMMLGQEQQLALLKKLLPFLSAGNN